MRQALHIFVKDVRRLRYEILVVLAVAATFAWVDGLGVPWRNDPAIGRADTVLKLLLVVAWWFLIARTVYEDSPVGHTQFWVTRPYQWRSLLGAKLLFVIAFINLPLFLSDCAIVAMRGFDPLAYPAALACHQLVVCVWLLLPVAALACVTEGVSQLALALLAVLLIAEIPGMLSLQGAAGSGPTDWITPSLVGAALLAAALATIFLQYRARRTWVGRGVMAGALTIFLALPPLMPFGSAFAVEARALKPRLDASGITLELSADQWLPRAKQVSNPGDIRVDLPVDLAGLPASVLPITYKAWASLYSPGSDRPSSSYPVALSVTAPPVFVLWVPAAAFEKLRTGSESIHLVAFIGVYGEPRSGRLPIESGRHRVPGIGACGLLTDDLSAVEAGSATNPWLGWQCETPFRTPPLVTARLEGTKGWGRLVLPFANSPYPATFGIDPMAGMRFSLRYKPGSSAVVLTAMQPQARIHREIDIPGSRFAGLNYTGAPAARR